jgi:DNA polymerase
MEGVQTLPDQMAAANLLRWWRDAGVDVLVGEEPRPWLRTLTPPPAGERDGREAARERGREADASSPEVTSLRHPLSAKDSVDAALPATLAELLIWMAESGDVPEARWGRARLLPSGNPQSDLMILTDMPEPDDAEAGQLLSGEVGALFDRMLAAIGLGRDTIWLSPFATIRSIGRIPSEAHRRLAEIARHQIALVAPKRLLIMGKTPNEALIGPDWQERRGALHSLNLGAVQVETVSTFHPRLLHERPSYKAQAWKDLQLLTKGLT